MLRDFRRFFVSSHRALGRLSGLGMRRGCVRIALLGGMRRSGFGRVRMMLRNFWMRDLGWDHRSRQCQRSRKRQQLPDHVIVFGRE